MGKIMWMLSGKNRLEVGENIMSRLSGKSYVDAEGNELYRD